MRILIIAIAVLLLTGCATTGTIHTEPTLIKCQIPDIPQADLKPINDTASYPEKLQIILNNYLLLQRENELLRKAIEVCR